MCTLDSKHFVQGYNINPQRELLSLCCIAGYSLPCCSLRNSVLFISLHSFVSVWLMHTAMRGLSHAAHSSWLFFLFSKYLEGEIFKRCTISYWHPSILNVACFIQQTFEIAWYWKRFHIQWSWVSFLLDHSWACLAFIQIQRQNDQANHIVPNYAALLSRWGAWSEESNSQKSVV